MPFPVRSATHHVIGLTEEVPPRNVVNPCDLRRLVVQSLLSAALANESEFGQDPPPMVPIRCVLNLYYFFLSYNIYMLKADDDGPIRMDHEPRRRSLDSGRDPKASSIISTISFTGGHAANEDDMWSFTEAARKDLIGRTLAQTSNNAVMPKDKKRKFVMDIESRIAATIGFTPPQVWKE
jgi:hypothetical protein